MTVLDEARAAIPGYTEATRALDHIRGWLTDAGIGEDRAAVHADAVAELHAAAERGDPLPAHALDRIAAFDQRQASQLARHRVLRGAYDDALARRDALLKNDAAPAYAVLVDRLAELYDEVNAARDRLASAVDADTAIRSGDPDAFGYADGLCQRYMRIRSAHVQLVAAEAHDGITSATVAVCGQAPDPLAIDPYWHRRRQDVRTTPNLPRDRPAVAEFLEWCAAAPESREPERSSIWPHDRSQATWLLTVAATAPVAPRATELAEIRGLCETAVAPPRDAATVERAVAARRLLAGEDVAAPKSVHHVTIGS